MLTIVTSSQLCLLLVSSSPWNFFHNCWLYSCQMKHLDEFEMLPIITVHLWILILTFLQLLIPNLLVKLFLYLTQMVWNYLNSYFGQQKISLPVCTTFNPIHMKGPFYFLLILKIQSFSTTFWCQFRTPQCTKSSTCITKVPQRASSLWIHWNIASS